MPARRVPLFERFWSKVNKKGPDECWLWTGSAQRGYGQISDDYPSRKMFRAHRLAYKLYHGELPESQKVLHTCDNPPCVNPAHLFLGTAVDNVRDMVKKGRQAKHEQNGGAKLTEEQVAKIRCDYIPRHPVYGQRAQGRRYGVSHSMIGYIVRGENWL